MRRTRTTNKMNHTIKKVKCRHEHCEKMIAQFNSLQKYCGKGCEIADRKSRGTYTPPKVNKVQQRAKKRPTGEGRMFIEIWNERPHFSEVSGKPLLPATDRQWAWQFAHILPKGSFHSQRLNKENIMLMLPSEHENQERYDKFQQKKTELLNQYYKK